MLRISSKDDCVEVIAGAMVRLQGDDLINLLVAEMHRVKGSPAAILLDGEERRVQGVNINRMDTAVPVGDIHLYFAPQSIGEANDNLAAANARLAEALKE